jgi:hypothetical protein
MSRAGQRARLDRLLEKIGPRLERIRVEGAASPGELSGTEPPFVIDELTGRRIYVSEASIARLKGLAAADAVKASASRVRLPTDEELAESPEEANARLARAAAKDAAPPPREEADAADADAAKAAAAAEAALINSDPRMRLALARRKAMIAAGR